MQNVSIVYDVRQAQGADMGNLSKSVSVRFDPEVLSHLKTVARRESAVRDEDLTWSDLIRESVLQVYPMPQEDEDSYQNNEA